MPNSIDAMSTSSEPTPSVLFTGEHSSFEASAFSKDLELLAESEFPIAALVDAAIRSVGSERGFFLQQDGDEWSVRAARSFEGEDVLHPLEKVIIPLLQRCVERGEGFTTQDLQEEDVWPSLERQRTSRTQALSIFLLPERSGALYLDHRFQKLQLPGDRSSLTTILALFSWLLTRERGAKNLELLQEDLRRAKSQARDRRSRTESPTPKTENSTTENLIIGENREILEVQALINKIAPSDAPILITGESGTGKELVARSIHQRSPRSDQPFISENCGAITETLLESELFGCVKGAFTGAEEDRPGLFELASGGTIFLDEIGDTSPGLQKKLLRVLQEGLVRRVGGSEMIPVQVRVLSATNRDLYQEVQAGNFREDLFYRLNVINVQLPPLRDRSDDIPILAEHFVRLQNERSGELKEISTEWLEALLAHHWPGNVRELQNEVRRSHALSGDRLDPTSLSPRVGGPPPDSSEPFSLDTVLETGSLKLATDQFEKLIISGALQRFRGNRAKVCETLGIPKTTLYAKIRRYSLD